MDFGSALQQLRINNHSVGRESWGGVRSIRIDQDRIVEVTSQSVGTYVPTQDDMLADDWRFALPEATVVESMSFSGDPWPGSPPDTQEAPVAHAHIELDAPPGGFETHTNDPHAQAARLGPAGYGTDDDA